MRCPGLRATNTFEAICFYSYTRSTDASFHGQQCYRAPRSQWQKERKPRPQFPSGQRSGLDSSLALGPVLPQGPLEHLQPTARPAARGDMRLSRMVQTVKSKLARSSH